MTIETKYNIGDEVWVKDDKGKMRHSTIHAIKYGIWDDYYGAEVDLGVLPHQRRIVKKL